MNRSCDYSFCAFQSCEKRVCGKELRREKALVSNQRPLGALKARTHIHPATPDQAVRDWHHPNQATVATSTSATQSHHSSRQTTIQRRITPRPLATMKFLSTLALLGTAAATSLHLSISPSSSLLDLSTLPASTHATLSGPSGKRHRTPLRLDNSFIFTNLEEGEYLLDIHSRDHVFPSLRVDVLDPVSILPVHVDGDGVAAEKVQQQETVVVYLTHPSNKWDHLGAKIATSSAPLSSNAEVKLAVSALGKREFLEKRQGFDILSFFKNPMILMGVLSMGLVFGMPYLMDNSEFYNLLLPIPSSLPIPPPLPLPSWKTIY